MFEGLNTIILLLFGLTALSALVVVIMNVVRRQHGEQRMPPAERTEEQKAQDRASEKVWLFILVAAVAIVAGLYIVFR